MRAVHRFIRWPAMRLGGAGVGWSLRTSARSTGVQELFIAIATTVREHPGAGVIP